MEITSETHVNALLKFSKGVDWLNGQIGKYVIWLILASTVISAINAVVRKALNIGSNAFLEVQWYLFAASFMIASAYTLLNGEHVKIDVVSSKLSKRAQIWIDVIGFSFFLTPMCLAILYYGVPFFLKGVADGPEPLKLFQSDRIHPNENAHPLMLATVWPELRKLLPK